MLGHKHLGHISKQKVEKLVSDGILDSLDLTNLKHVLSALRGNKQMLKLDAKKV